ncbi:hypothetical protein TR631_33695 [Streptomyces rochei]|uniref:hypothetical protein n=1 Tax=Streptomyces TaxID=1883 RepID=UPI0025B06F17|nr:MULTISPECIES: hypothetical protein [Streptomyces]MDN3244113.1 hypothetical protein [Streptomyces sp. ZSW22]WQC16517.1 hypothetical protein TR631_33695 [Streptomyces rochei]
MTTEPFGCRHCGVPKSQHGRRYHREAGVHQWQQPTPEQIKDRMRARRAATKEQP